MSSGKGISDAVRGAIREWITADVSNRLWEEFKKFGATQTQNSFQSRLRQADYWVRRVRRGHISGWERDYDCKAFPRGVVGLRVHTDQDDRYIKYVTFRVNGKLIGGGEVRVPSVFLSQAGRNASIKNQRFESLAPASNFRPFTADELHQLEVQAEYGEAGVLGTMFEERV
jgi:hypothetical protein